MSLRAELVKSVPKVCLGFREDITSFTPELFRASFVL